MIVTCQSCKQEVYKTTQPLYGYDLASASHLKGINGFDDPKPGDKIECPNCKSEEGLRKGIVLILGDK